MFLFSVACGCDVSVVQIRYECLLDRPALIDCRKFLLTTSGDMFSELSIESDDPSSICPGIDMAGAPMALMRLVLGENPIESLKKPSTGLTIFAGVQSPSSIAGCAPPNRSEMPL